jgi:hypothetical protein
LIFLLSRAHARESKKISGGLHPLEKRRLVTAHARVNAEQSYEKDDVQADPKVESGKADTDG